MNQLMIMRVVNDYSPWFIYLFYIFFANVIFKFEKKINFYYSSLKGF